MVKVWEHQHERGEPTTITLVTTGEPATDCAVELRPLGYSRMTFSFGPEEAIAIGEKLVQAGKQARVIEASAKRLAEAMGAVGATQGDADER